ncbi:hypothetical protein LINPERHAP2_LOCUS3287, partial [Linum perenne]
MPLGDHTRTYLHQYTQLIKFSNVLKSSILTTSSLSGLEHVHRSISYHNIIASTESSYTR